MADFKIPTVGKAFPVFCQRIIPLTFDNSLSYLEFLGHMNAKLNEVICALNEEGVAIQELAQLVDSTLDSFKREIQELINANKAEIMQAIDDLRTDLQGEITDLQDDVLIIKDELRLVNSQITDIIRTKGNVSIFPEIEGSVDYTMQITTSNCDVYYKIPGSDIWHESATDTDLISWAAGETSESIGDKDFLFMFHGPEGYPEEQFIFPAGAVLTAEAAEAEGNAVKLYSRATIPGEDFNTGLILYADAEIVSSGGTSTATLTATQSVPDINCLYISNSFALAQLDPVTYTLSLTVPEIFGQLFNQETGNNVFPRIKINNTLAYDSVGRLGAVSALPAQLPDNLAYFGSTVTGTKDAYSLIFDTPCVIYENYSDGVTQNSWKQYQERTLRDFLPNYTGWLNPSTGTSKNLYVFFENIAFPAGFKFLTGADGIETGYTGVNFYNGTWIDFGHTDTIPTLSNIPSFVRLYKESLSIIGDATVKSRTAKDWSMTIATGRAKYVYIYGNAFFFRALRTTLENGYGQADTFYITTPSATYPITDEDGNILPLAIPVDDTLQAPQGVLGISDSFAQVVENIPAALASKQDIIDSTHKLSADLVDDTSATNKFATAAQLSQIATNTNAIAGKQDTIDSSHKLDADLVDDTSSTNKFATQAQLDQITLNETNISSNAADDYLAWTKGKNKLNFDINTARALNTSSVYTWSSNTCTVNGITFTFNADNTITATGTIADSQSNTILSLVSYIGVSGDVLSAQQSGNAYIYLRGGSTATASAPYSTWASGDVGVARTVAIVIASTETSAVNKTFYPMVCTAADWQKSQEYYPYAMSNVELTAAIQAIQAQLAN